MSEELLHRTFAAELAAEGEGTLSGRLVPYGVPAMVADLGVPYEEMFAPEAFARDPLLRKSPHRVELLYDHRDGILDRLALGVSFQETEDGLHGVFRALDTVVGEQGLALARAGVLRAFSVGFRALRSRRENGCVIRQVCRLGEVSLVRDAAYKGTEVSVRKALADLERPMRNADLDSRLSVLGFRD